MPDTFDKQNENKRQVGSDHEEKACRFLMSEGYRILKRNYRVRSGEIDIIARDKDTLVFIEVKYRAGKRSGTPEEAVGIKKQQKIAKTALFYLKYAHISPETKIRFDVIAIVGDEIRLIKDAFPFPEMGYADTIW